MKISISGKDLIIENATNADILPGTWRNFAGEKRKFNNEGDHNFNVRIDPADVEYLRENGVKVKERAPRDDDGEEPMYYIKVKVNMRSRKQPNINMITGRRMTKLNDDTLMLLDTMQFENVDLVISLYNYEVNGSSGVSLYLNTGYFTQHLDPIADKYAAYQTSPDDGEEDYE